MRLPKPSNIPQAAEAPRWDWPDGAVSAREAELIARALAFEAVKWLLRSGDGPGEDDGSEEDRRFVRDGDGRVWVTRPILRARGWTDAAVRDFLPEPEGLKRNPRFARTGSPMRVWRAETIAGAEAAPEWRQWLERSLERRGTTLERLADTDDEGFRGRLEAVQRAIDDHRKSDFEHDESRDSPAETGVNS